MEGLPVSPVDIGIAAIVLISGLLAFARGFVRETLAIGGWVGAGFVTLYGFVPLRPYARAYVSPDGLADGITGVAIFILSLIVFAIIGRLIGRLVQKSQLNALDRSLGFLFGVARGAVIVALAYLAYDWTLAEEEKPKWLVEARTLPLVAWGAESLQRLVPSDVSKDAAAKAAAARKRVEQGLEADRAARRLSSPPPLNGDKDRKGYSGAERRALDRRIETTR